MKPEPIVLTALGVSLLAVTVIASDLKPTTSSFTTAKKRAMEITADHQETLYCGCRFDADNSVHDGECGYVPRNMFTGSGDVNKRTSRIEWEHVVTAHRMGKDRKCWQDKKSFPECQYASGRWRSNRECCRKVDPEFKAMEADLHNLWPAVGELNGDRSDKEYGGVVGEPREYGACDFEVTKQTVEPAQSIWGEIARAYLYMEQVWGLKLLEEEQVQFRAWSEADPPPPGNWNARRGSPPSRAWGTPS